MQLIFLLLVLFALGCSLYGIYARGSAIGQIGVRMGEQEQRPIPWPLPKIADTPPKACRDYIAELKALRALHQSSALTEEEFAQLKTPPLGRDEVKRRYSRSNNHANTSQPCSIYLWPL